jgi:hypothetical protein
MVTVFSRVASIKHHDLSLVIPVYDPKRELEHFVARLAKNVSSQTLLPTELIFTSNHEYPLIESLRNEYSEKLSITHILNDSKNAADNLNSAIFSANCNLIKILFQDDYFLHANSFEKMTRRFEKSNKKWMICGSRDVDFRGKPTRRYKIPRVGESLSLGVNSVSAPSVIFLRRDFLIPLNNNLLYLVDCDWYLKLWHHFGKPVRLIYPHIGIQIHDKQATNTLNRYFESEKLVVSGAHLKPSVQGSACSCVQTGGDTGLIEKNVKNGENSH